jgi:uncharacterized membrane protein YbhN (UPF0104 family)
VTTFDTKTSRDRGGEGSEGASRMNLLVPRPSSEPASLERVGLDAVAASADSSRSVMPDELSPRHLRRRLLEFAAVGVLIGIVVLAGPGLGQLRSEVARGSPGWLIAGVGLEVLSALSYVVIFRAVFCPRMSWRLSYQIGMSEQAANSVLSVSGTGGLALGAWALRRDGMSAENIGRKSVAFFFLTSLANVAGVAAFAALYAVGVLVHDRNAALTYGFGAAALAATAIVLALPAVLTPVQSLAPANDRRLATVLRFVRYSLGQGVRDAVQLLRRRSLGVLIGSLGTVTFDLAVLGVCFLAFGYSPPIGVLALGYLIGQLGGNIPVPGGIGGIELGLIGTFALYHQPLATTTAAVLVYHAIALWAPACSEASPSCNCAARCNTTSGPPPHACHWPSRSRRPQRHSGSPKSIAYP